MSNTLALVDCTTSYVGSQRHGWRGVSLSLTQEILLFSILHFVFVSDVVGDDDDDERVRKKLEHQQEVLRSNMYEFSRLQVASSCYGILSLCDQVCRCNFPRRRGGFPISFFFHGETVRTDESCISLLSPCICRTCKRHLPSLLALALGNATLAW